MKNIVPVEFEPPTLGQRVATFFAVVIPFVGLIVGIVLAWGRGLGWTELILLFVLYVATGFGITVGYHRLFVHRAFETVKPIQFLMVALGSAAVQGTLFKWSAIHRKHHQYSDCEKDPHSPQHHGGGVRGVFLGLFHAHVGWMFTGNTSDLDKYIRDLKSQKLLRVANDLCPLWMLLGLVVPAAIAGLIGGTWYDALLGFIWGGLVRVLLVQHVTFSVNSVCHVWGKRPYDCHDQSKNNFIVGVLALGEGWHNNHHAFPTSARHGLKWWEFDLSYIFIRTLSILGLAWEVRVPGTNAMKAKPRTAA